MLNYVAIQVSDLERSAAFYDSVLNPLGWRRQTETANAISWGMIKGVFYITSGSPRPGFGNISFPTKSIPAVKASWEAGMGHGAENESPPGSPPYAGPGNYAARLVDPDGYTVEISVAND